MKKIKCETMTVLSVALLILLSMSITMSCSSATNASQPTGHVETVSVAQFEDGIKKGDIQLLDVRTSKEYAEGHIRGALNIDVQEPDFEASATDTLNKEKPVYVYCRSGRRSLLAGEMLAKDGYTVVDLDGGIIAWQNNGLPIEQ